MELQPKDSSLFRTAIEGLKDFLPEAHLVVTPDGLVISGMDAAHVGFVKYTLAAADCAVLKVAVPQTLGVSLTILSKVLASVGAADVVTLRSSDEHLTVSFVNEKLKKKTVCNVPLMEIHVDALDIPSLDYAMTVEAKTADVAALFKEVGAFGDTLSLFLSDDGFQVKAKNERGEMTQVLENTEGREMEFTEDFKSPVSFGTKYLISMLKCALSTQIKLQINADTPMCLTYKVGISNTSSLVFHLAPKMGDEA
jgi:hypothetical protein